MLIAYTFYLDTVCSSSIAFICLKIVFLVSISGHFVFKFISSLFASLTLFSLLALIDFTLILQPVRCILSCLCLNVLEHPAFSVTVFVYMSLDYTFNDDYNNDNSKDDKD